MSVKVGDVVYLHCDSTKPPKGKLLVVSCLDPLLLFYIYSRISSFDKKNDNLLSCNVEIKSKHYKFLKHGSYIRCCDVNTEFCITWITDKIKHERAMKGYLKRSDVIQMVHAVKASMPLRYKNQLRIVESLEASTF